MTTILSQIESTLRFSGSSWFCRGISVVPNSSRTGPKLKSTSLLHSSSAVECFKLFITDDFVPKMAEQTN